MDPNLPDGEKPTVSTPSPSARADSSSEHAPTVHLGEAQHGSGAGTVYPQAGEEIAGYHLVAELGRGGQGRVFLARQISLAGRAVVLKFTPCQGAEHFNLARLQHTSIVPLFGAEDIGARNLRILCMPFLGAITLGELLTRLKDSGERSVKHVEQVLQQVDGAFAADLPQRGNVAAVLGKSSYQAAVCQMGLFLAEALEFAHKNGLVHLDIKPSNILLAPDGRPLLLDFHLARTPIKQGDTRAAGVGGTPRYMSPEQWAAIGAVTAGQPIPATVDHRSDIYSLGLVLYEALGGQRKGRDPVLLAKLAARADVSPGLVDILAKCLAEKPEDRYADANALAEDLTHHLHDLPLPGVGNRSWRESWQKWRRRSPLALPVSALIMAVTVATIATGAVLYSRYQHKSHDAEMALEQGKVLLREQNFDDALSTFRGGLDRLGWAPGTDSMRKALEREYRRAEYLKTAHELHKIVDAIRFYSLIEPLPKRSLLLLDGAADNLVRTLEEIDAPADMTEDIKERTRADLADLLAFRAENAEALGLKSKHGLPETKSNEPPTMWDLTSRARAHMRRGREAETETERSAAFKHAEKDLRSAAAQQPLHYLPQFYLGYCLYRQNKYVEAVSAFSFCLGQESGGARSPMSLSSTASAFYFRALCYQGHGQRQLALADFEQALKRDSSFEKANFERDVLQTNK